MKERGMYIPTIGDEVTLASDWTFLLFYEYRNAAMIKFIFPGTEFKYRDMVLPSGEMPEYLEPIARVLLPMGAVLKVDRIYIRKGKGEYDSVTLILQSVPKKEIAVPDERDVWITDKNNLGRSIGGGKYVKKTFTKSKIRFWAKLKDVNEMRFYMGREEIEKDERPAVRRLIRVEEELNGR